ncbi:unnamed protein product [Brassicogethes aeneus]|uniref:Uncharacterized protein n=1 Tax=Brassicogethes aeneus TaxID=1431903 RepID=A0A9P0FL10_BRAAE|nr:unnamed protein product [Brassicogethes aeneus]
MPSLTFSIFHPFLVGKFISYFKLNQRETTLMQAFGYSLELMVLEFAYQLIQSSYNLSTANISIKIRVAISSIIFRKVLKISNEVLGKISVGNVISLMTKDVAIVEKGLKYSMDFIICIIQLLMTCVVLYVNMGAISLSAILFMFLVLGVEVLIGQYISHIRVYIDYKTGERIKTTKECLASLKVVKMLSLENFFLQKISYIRRLEVNGMLKDAYAKSIIQILCELCPDLMIYILVMSYVYMQVYLDASLVFYIMSCVRSVRIIITFLVPVAIGAIADFKGGITRINRILNEEEMEEKVEEFIEKPELSLKHVTVKFEQKEVISNASLDIKTGITSVIGGSGSGKSTLLLAILRENPSQGNLVSKGRISYASQDPWLFPGSIKQNILFGEDYKMKRYHKVLKVCGLDWGLMNVRDGEETYLLNGGSNLSKGQQSRINLARAVYKDSDIYLLDDCLSSLDKKIQRQIINGMVGYLKDKICLIVTQNDDLVKASDYILSLENGQAKLITNNTLVSKEVINECIVGDIEQTTPHKERNIDECTEETNLVIEPKNFYSEIQNSGKVQLKYYLKYMKFGRGYFVYILILLLFGASQYAENNSTKNLTKLIDIEQQKLTFLENATAYSITSEKSNETTKMYGILLFLALGLTLIKVLLFYDFAKTVSIKVHKKLTSKILNSTMRFIDTHLLGSVLNRFSQDLNNIDEILPMNFLNFIRALSGLSGIIILIVMVHYKLILPILVLSIILALIWKFCISSTRSLKRLETSSRSPFIGHINATVDGIKTIRAHNCSKVQNKIFEEYHDSYMSTYYSGMVASLGYLFYMNITCFIVIYAIVWSFMFILTGISAGNVGLTLVELFSITKNITMLFRTFTDSEMMMTSFERVMEYTENEQENKNGVDFEDFPKEASIKFKNVSMAYDEIQVLSDINLSVEPRQKVGIIGKSGSGKSSMLSLLMRLYEYDGDISIGDIDIKSIPLESLRGNIDVIPQDPVLFSSSMRDNLDPFEQHTDEKIWEVIKKLNITHVVPTLHDEIDPAKYSGGEKQLICLARAMLRKSKILIMDEATAYVDVDIEQFLRTVIDQHFPHCTIISIAHKINSLQGYDKVYLLENGTLTEYYL